MDARGTNAQTTSVGWALSDDLYSVESARGSYSPTQFVVRLRPDVKSLLEGDDDGVFKPGEVSSERILAFSTFFHEITHWWQHVGSTTGLLLSLAYPAQCHVNVPHLRKFVEAFGPHKSVRTFVSENYGQLPEEPRKDANIVLNNWHDVEFNSRILLDPVRAEPVVRNAFFENVGHSLRMSLEHTIWLLSASFDPVLSFLPDVRTWSEPFKELSQRRVEGYYYGSPIRLLPLGVIQIFEGQARFHQLQYIYLASSGRINWDGFRELGMLSDVYVGAFLKFLEWTESDWPDSPVSPLTQLFLLLCELSTNPSDGYPFPLHHFESFVISDDPSFRFYWMARHIAKNPSLKASIRNCSQEECDEISATLCKTLGCATPTEIARELCRWSGQHDTIQNLLKEDETFAFRNENLPVRVLFAKHLRYAQDRINRPEFFCWPAMHFVGADKSPYSLEESLEIVKRHQPLFTASFDGEIRPSLFAGKPEGNVQQTFNDFYRWNLLYDVVRQWIIADGPLNYDYTWLTPNYRPSETKPWVDEMFFEALGFQPDDFLLV